MTYEAWRMSYQDSEQAARAAFEEAQRLRAENAQLHECIRDVGELIDALDEAADQIEAAALTQCVED